MKKLVWYSMSEEERKVFLEEAINKRRARMQSPKNQKLRAIAEEKIAHGKRLTVEEFEAYTGVMFSHNMTGKMDGILALSTNVLMNQRCQKRQENPDLICHECYAANTQLMYSYMFENTAYNAKYLSTKLIPEEVMPEIYDSELRGEPFGDSLNEIHSGNFFRMGRANPDVDFTTWSKNPSDYGKGLKLLGLTEKDIPDKSHFMMSSPRLNVEAKIPETYRGVFKKTFTVYTLDWLLENGKSPEFINCGGRSCKKCQRCYRYFNETEPSVRELLKADHARARKMGFEITD